MNIHFLNGYKKFRRYSSVIIGLMYLDNLYKQSENDKEHRMLKLRIKNLEEKMYLINPPPRDDPHQSFMYF